MAEQTRFDLSQDEMPTAWFNIMPRSCRRACSRSLRCTREPRADRASRPRAAVPRVADHAGGVAPSRGSTSPGQVLDIYRLWRPTPLYPCRRAGAGAADAGAHLLQVRGGVAGRLAQAEHRRRAGLLQQGSGDQAHRHRDRGRAMGVGAGDARASSSGSSAWCSWSRPRTSRSRTGAIFMETFGARSTPRPRHHAGRQGILGTSRLHGFAGDRHQRGGRGRGHERRHQLRARERC